MPNVKFLNGEPVYPFIFVPMNDIENKKFNVFSDENWMKENGYLFISEEDMARIEEENKKDESSSESPVESVVKRYSPYQIKAHLREIGMWEVVKDMLTPDEYENFLLADDFATDNEDFKETIEKFKTMNGFEEILKQCEITE